MNIEHDLLPKQKSRKYGLAVTIDLFPLATELYEELEKVNVTERLTQVKQLGPISTAKQLEKTRYDYVILQLYFHQIIRKNIQSDLKYTYNNRIKLVDFLNDQQLDIDIVSENTPVTLADIIQMLVILYNIGHFYNTFVASRAVTMLAARDETFFEHIIHASPDERYQYAASCLLKSHNYQRVHLLNTFLALDKCDQTKRSVRIAKELILSYLLENELSAQSRLHEYFVLFRKVRTAAFVAYDLQIAGVPFTIDLWNKEGLLYFFKEYLAEFNNTDSAEALISQMAKMLDASVYNEVNNVICSTLVSKKMIGKLCADDKWDVDYFEYWRKADSVLNTKYPQRHDYETHYLKITFKKEHQTLSEKLYEELDRQNHTRVGYYLRHSGEMTIVVSIQKACVDKKKVAFKVLKAITCYGRRMHLSPDDSCFVLAVKYFLYYLFNEKQVTIKPVVHETKCVICSKGKNSRISELQKLLVSGSNDEKHEVEAMIMLLKKDTVNDTAITISGSTVVYKNKGEAVSEFDGIIIYPNRNNEQVIFLEAKNTCEKPGYGKKCLHKKLKALKIPYDYKKIVVFDHDAYYKTTV